MKDDNKKRCDNCNKCDNGNDGQLPIIDANDPNNPFNNKCTPQKPGHVDLTRYGKINLPKCTQIMANEIAKELRKKDPSISQVKLVPLGHYMLSGYKGNSVHDPALNSSNNQKIGKTNLSFDVISMIDNNNIKTGHIIIEGKNYSTGHNSNGQVMQPNDNLSEVMYLNEMYDIRLSNNDISFKADYSQNKSSLSDNITIKNYQLFEVNKTPKSEYEKVVIIYDNTGHETLLVRTMYTVSVTKH